MHDNQKKGKKLIWQVLPWLYIATFVTTIICGVFMYFYSLDIMLNAQRQECYMLTESLVNYMDQFSYMEWYVPYWIENCDNMDIDVEKDLVQQILHKDSELSKVFDEHASIDKDDVVEPYEAGDGYVYTHDYSGLNPEELSPELQKLLAEYVYLKVLDSFNIVKNGSNLKYLYCVSQIEGETMMFMFSGKTSREVFGDSGDEIFKLGKLEPISKKRYPGLYETYKSGKSLEGQALFNGDTTMANRYHFYTPLCDSQGRTLCVIAACGEINNIDKLISMPYMLMMIFYVAAMMLGASIVALILRRRAIQPIKFIQKSIKKYTEVKSCDELKVDLAQVKSNNEIGLLANGLNLMGEEINTYIEDIKKMSKHQERLNTELYLAKRIQKSALIKEYDSIPNSWNLKLSANMKPAKEVGGDFYDFVVLDEDHIALIIGDVSGKGVPAALLMMICLAFFKNECKYSSDPEIILDKVNDSLCSRNIESMFVTAWIGILEISTGKLSMANAGHENPIIRRKDGSVEVIKDKHGLVLAAMEDISYKRSELVLEHGDMLVVYTDGVAEAIDCNECQYGVDRLVKYIETHDYEEPQDYIDGVYEDLNDFVGEAEQFDDITMLMTVY